MRGARNFMLALFIGGSVNVSFSFSNAREDNNYLKLWFKYSMVWVFAGYVLFVIGMLEFFGATHEAIKISYPT